MRTLLAILLLASSVIAQGQSTTFALTLTSENNGADTRFSWSYTGSPAHINLEQNSIGVLGVFLASGAAPSISGPTNTAFGIAPVTVTGLSTGLTMTNSVTGVSKSITELQFFPGEGVAVIALVLTNAMSDPNASVLLAPGQQAVLSGPATGSFLTDIDFSTFSAGSWTYDSIEYNFVPVLTIGGGAPVPEPSTYGLMLGGLALAGAVIRRRKTSK